MFKGRIISISVCILVGCGVAMAKTVRVPEDSMSIFAGMTAAESGDTVLVAPGTYYERNIALRSGVCLRSGGDRAGLATIDAQGSGRVLTCVDLDSATRVEGLVITGGYDPYNGAGAYCDASRLTFSDCRFVGNTVGSQGRGGAMFCQGSSPRIERCTFEGNKGYEGGAIALVGGSPVLSECVITDNQAQMAGAVTCLAGAVFRATDCEFSGNSSLFCEGGAVACLDGGRAVLTRCTFRENSAGTFGGAVACVQTSGVVLQECVFFRNSAYLCGGAVHCWSASADLENCTIFGSESTCGVGGGIGCQSTSEVVIRHSIIAFSSCGEAVSGDGETVLQLDCCDVYGNAGGDWVGVVASQAAKEGNMCCNPLFCDTSSGDLHLQSESPCAPEGNECGVLTGALGMGCFPTAVDDALEATPEEFWLSQNYPNPFNPSTYIEYSVPQRTEVSLAVYNVLGQRLKTLVDGVQASGRHTAIWDGRDGQGRVVASGAYFYRLAAGDRTIARKMLLIR